MAECTDTGIVVRAAGPIKFMQSIRGCIQRDADEAKKAGVALTKVTTVRPHVLACFFSPLLFSFRFSLLFLFFSFFFPSWSSLTFSRPLLVPCLAYSCRRGCGTLNPKP